jgi:hypothetical protein
MDRFHGWWTTTGLHGSPWTGGGADRRVLGRGGMLVGVGPSATPGRGSSPIGWEMESRAWGSRFWSHQGSGSGVVAGRL